MELGSLVRRDHDDLHYALRVMTEPLSDEVHIVTMLDRVRKMFPAHADAETVALAKMLEQTQPPPSVYFLVSQVTAAHLAQEAVLTELVTLKPGSITFRERARYLRHLMIHHADHEATCLHPTLPEQLPRDLYSALGTAYLAERSRVLETHGDVVNLRKVG